MPDTPLHGAGEGEGGGREKSTENPRPDTRDWEGLPPPPVQVPEGGRSSALRTVGLLAVVLLLGLFGLPHLLVKEPDGGEAEQLTDADGPSEPGWVSDAGPASAVEGTGDADPEAAAPPISSDSPASANGIEWVDVPGGELLMGAAEHEAEGPVRSVQIEPFRMSKAEITVAQYRRCVEEGPCAPPGETARDDGATPDFGPCNGGEEALGRHPVNCVSWADARLFARWVGGRLPSEAEWEHAARSADSGWEHPWGDEAPDCDRAVMGGCGHSRTAPACSRPDGNSAQGLCDLLGNVWEWVEDDWHGDFSGAPADGEAWWETPRIDRRVIRGAAWADPPERLRVTIRTAHAPSSRFPFLGFRVAKSLPMSPPRPGGSDSGANRSPEYLGQAPPGKIPEVFAPGVVSKPDRHEFGSVFSRDGRTLYLGVDVGGRAEILESHFEGDSWGEQVRLLPDEPYSHNDPFLSPDEDRLYFISNRPLSGRGDQKDIDIWYVERREGGWSEPVNAGPRINSERDEYYISFTKDGSMYFASNAAAGKDEEHDFDIYVSEHAGGEFQTPKRLGAGVNTGAYEADVFVDPDGEYLIFSANRREGLGRGDLYISFRDEEGGWAKARNLGEGINSAGHELCPFVTLDGKYFFYTSRQDIYWVDAGILDSYR